MYNMCAFEVIAVNALYYKLLAYLLNTVHL